MYWRIAASTNYRSHKYLTKTHAEQVMSEVEAIIYQAELKSRKLA